uniref:hypothetical protein 49 n=1 Tax=Moniliophthora perniciosa TaxID=153609 RepID=UPI000024235E|nr:hypothetical protein 49 [Moniliophthora perniciosa]AAQ74338.1 hypothetical protein 49 [Moniliophthora perniciosa]
MLLLLLRFPSFFSLLLSYPHLPFPLPRSKALVTQGSCAFLPSVACLPSLLLSPPSRKRSRGKEACREGRRSISKGLLSLFPLVAGEGSKRLRFPSFTFGKGAREATAAPSVSSFLLYQAARSRELELYLPFSYLNRPATVNSKGSKAGSWSKEKKAQSVHTHKSKSL